MISNQAQQALMAITMLLLKMKVEGFGVIELGLGFLSANEDEDPDFNAPLST